MPNDAKQRALIDYGLHQLAKATRQTEPLLAKKLLY